MNCRRKDIMKNIVKHIKTVAKHRWIVFKLCCRVGIPWRGLVHDLSKFSPTEFWESTKYYVGIHSPIPEARKDKGYSQCWLHHKGVNKHHIEYWVDFDTKQVALVMPYKYAVEMVCDNLSAGIVYNGKKWTQSTQYDYWIKNRKREKIIINPKVDNFLTQVFLQIKENGIDKTLTKKNMKELYKKYCIDDTTEYKYEFKGEWKKIEK
jgi:hypothetical protein